MIVRINNSLLRRGYLLWLDLEMMKGSTMVRVCVCAYHDHLHD